MNQKGLICRRDAKGFDNFIRDNNLLDLAFNNTCFTWFGPNGKCSKLDRFLVNDKWFEVGTWQAISLCRNLSDHKPILISVVKDSWGPRPFRAFNWWLLEPTVGNILEQFWKEMQSADNKDNIQVILKKIKNVVGPWSKNVKSSLEQQIALLTNKMDDFYRNNIWGEEFNKCRRELEGFLRNQSAMLQQKSRITWLKKGDRNNKFFNQAIQRRNHRNGIQTIMVGNSMVNNPAEIKKAFISHFQALYNMRYKSILQVGGSVEKMISDLDISWLEREFRESEVELALSELASDKAPGPDGFNIHFLKSF